MPDTRKRWWSLEKSEAKDLSGEVFAVVDQIDHDGGEARRKRNLQHIGLYENRDLASITVDGLSVPTGVSPDNLTLNVSSSCVDALSSKIAPNKPKPMFCTVDGDFSEQQRAKGLQRFVMGNFHWGGVYKKAQRCFVDAGICDLGVMKVSSKKGKIVYERVFPNEILVDEKGAQYGEPRELYQRKFVATDVLVSAYPDHEDEIRSSVAQKLGTDTDTVRGLMEDHVQVIEAWHLPSGDGAKDGRHCIVVKNAVLLDDSWSHDSFPFAFLRWTTLPIGFWGQGLVEQLRGIQGEITTLVRRIQEAHRILGVPWVILPAGCQIKKGSLTNEIAQIIESSGGRDPQVDVHGVIAPEVYQHLIFLYEKAFEISGISQLSATSRKPAGVESGVALRTLLDTETQRFALLVEAWQEFMLDVARLTVREARMLGSNARVVYSEKEWGRAIKWSEVSLEEDRYVLQLWPVNLLPDTPTGKLAYAEQMITTGVFTPEEAKASLNYPDIEAITRTNGAARDLIEAIVEKMLTTGDYIAPTKYMDLNVGKNLVQGSYLRGMVNGWPEERLALLTQWLDEAAAILAPPSPPAPPTTPPSGAMPVAPPSPMGPEAAPPMMQPAGPMPA